MATRQYSGDDTRTAGGKITRNLRPPLSSRTPYARPSPSPVAEPTLEEETANPNWLSSLVYPAKVIVSGAGKILSFFGNDSSSSSEDDSENDDDNDVDEVENDELEKVLSPTSKSVNKRKIEQLVNEDTFSREEGNQLIRLIKSRMMGTNGTPGEGTPSTRNTAIMEARKWLQEKRSGSKKKLEAEIDSSSHFTRSEKGSPADMAKSYMLNRPTWASPSAKHVEFGSPLTFGMHFKDETPTSTLHSSERKKSSFAAGSWNLLDEIRRVRSKASEDFLSTAPLTKSNFSLHSSTNKQDILENKGNLEEAGPLESTHVEPSIALHDPVANSFLRDSQDGNAFQSADQQDLPQAVGVSALKYNKETEVNESRSTTAENGVTPPGYVQGENGADKPRPSKVENGNPVGSTQEREDSHMENSNMLTDPIDIPCTTVTDTVLNGSQSSSSVHEEDLSQDFSQPTGEGPPAKSKEAQKERQSRGLHAKVKERVSEWLAYSPN